MSIELDRQARRERIRARLAAERAGTELVTMTVDADEVAAGDWIESIEAERDLTGRIRVRGLSFGEDGARFVSAEPLRERHYVGPFAGEVVEHPYLLAFSVDGYDAYRIPRSARVVVRRRVAVSA